MELLFIYLGKYGNISNRTFNFNPQYKFELINDNERIIIHLQENKDWLNVFNDYDERITNVTAVAGENGSGKTTLFTFLMDFCKYQGEFPEKYPYIAIFLSTHERKKEKYIVYTNIKDRISLDPNIEPYSKEYDSDYELKQSISEQNFIYYTEAFNALSYERYTRGYVGSITNLSIEGRIASAILKEQKNHQVMSVDPIQSFLHWEVERQVDAFEAAPLPFEIRSISIKPVVPQTIEFLLDSNYSDEVNNIKLKMIEFYNSTNSISHRRNKGKCILRAVLASLIKFVMLGFSVRDPNINARIKDIYEIINEWENYLGKWKHGATIKNIIKFVNCVFKKGTIWPQGSEYIVPRYEEILALFSKRYVKFNEFTSTFYVSLKKSENRGYLMNWFRHYNESTHQGSCSYLTFEWGMSTGERSYFNLFAHLYSEYKQMEYKKDIILLLDEVDLYLHPKWQQEGVQRIINTVLACFPSCDIQIIFATHSPLLLSDIPSQHVIFLTKEENGMMEHKECFAANIYNLYKDAFFLDKDAVWVLGTFSKTFVNNIEKELAKLEERKGSPSIITEEKLQDIRNRISFIGEDLLKKILLQRWASLYKKYGKVKEENMSVEVELIIEEFSNLGEREKEKIRKELKI